MPTNRNSMRRKLNLSRTVMKRLSKEALRATIARNLRQARLTFDPPRTQEDVAALFDPPITRAAVAQWEIGETLPDIDRLAVLSKTYGVTIDSLIFGDEKPSKTGERYLSPEAERLLKTFEQLEDDKKTLVIRLILSMS